MTQLFCPLADSDSAPTGARLSLLLTSFYHNHLLLSRSSSALLLPSVQSCFSSLQTLPATKVFCLHKDISQPGVQVLGAALRQWLTGVEYEKPALLVSWNKLRHNLCSWVSLWGQTEVPCHRPLPEIAPRLSFLFSSIRLPLPYLLLLGAFHTESLARKHSSQSLFLGNLTQDNILALNSHSHSVRIKF